MQATPLPSVYLKEQTAIDGTPSSHVSSETRFQSHQHLSSVLFLSLLGCVCVGGGRESLCSSSWSLVHAFFPPQPPEQELQTPLSPHMLILITSQLVSKEGIIGCFSICSPRKPH